MNAECLFATSGISLLLVKLERIPAEPTTDRGSKDSPMEIRKGRVLFCIYNLGDHGFFFGLRKRDVADGELSYKGRREAPS